MGFSTIADGANLRILMTEIIEAYNERVEAQNLSYSQLPLADAQTMFNYIPTMQTNLQAPMSYPFGGAVPWADDTEADVSGEFTGQSEMPRLTTAAIQTAVGNGTGIWRRCRSHPATGPVFLTNGVAEDRDIVGWWTIADLQKAIDAYRWTIKKESGAQQQRRGENSNEDYATALSAAQSEWASKGWTASVASFSAAGWAKSTLFGGVYYVNLLRARVYSEYDYTHSDIECAVDIYALPTGRDTYDPQDTGMASGEDVLNLMNQIAQANQGVIERYTPTSEAAPTVGAGTTYDHGFNVPLGGMYAIAKWDFTHFL